MLLSWKIRYLDRNDRSFKDRYLSLETNTLEPALRAAVEFIVENQTNCNDREILKFRHLFVEYCLDSISEQGKNSGDWRSVGPNVYLEDENGKETTLAETGPIITGDPKTVLVPSGAKQHDLDFMFSEKKPIPIAEIQLSSDETRILGYFVRDLRELQDSALMKDGPGKLSKGGTLVDLPNGDYHLKTAATDDEIRSFVTIFRRLYMEKEPANFLKAVEVFTKALVDDPFAKWVQGVAGGYETHLQGTPEYRPFFYGVSTTFNVKRLIDVFIYTQYAHQPSENRQRQFVNCLNEVGNKRNFLTWLFLKEIWSCSLEIDNAGRVIAKWFNQYCNHHGITPDVLNSLRHEHAGLGTEEKVADRKSRIFREKVEGLEFELWKQAGKPEGGPVQFRLIAQEQLERVINGSQ